jgi:hypothetical protein
MSVKKTAALCLRSMSCGLLALLATAPAMADPFSPPKSEATLTITFHLTGGGDDLPASHERHITWSVDDRYVVSAGMVAEKPSGYAGMHKPDSAAVADLQQRQAAAAAGANDMQDMMAMAQAAMAKCGEDEACLQAEVIKMSQKVDPNSAQLQDAKKQAAIATAAPLGNRYQTFSTGMQSGQFLVQEKAHVALFDAACSLRNEPTCAVDSTVSGKGALNDGAGNTSFQTGAFAEIDTKEGSLIFLLPAVGFAQVKKVATSPDKHAKTGTFDEIRTLKADKLYGEQIKIACGECRAVHGTITRDVVDELLGRPAKLTIDWKFTRQ